MFVLRDLGWWWCDTEDSFPGLTAPSPADSSQSLPDHSPGKTSRHHLLNMDLDITDEAFVSGSESEVSEANYSSSSIALSDLSSGSEKSEERSMSDKSVQTDLEVEPLWRTRVLELEIIKWTFIDNN